MTSADVLGFVTAQHTGGGLGRLQPVAQGAAGVSARTVRRRLSDLFGFLLARGDVEVNRVPRGLPTRRERQRPRQGVPLVRTPRTLPRILQPAAVDALLAALRTYRDRAMVLGGLRRCEVLGLRPSDLRVAEGGVGLGEDVPDGGEDGAGHGDEGLALASAFDHARKRSPKKVLVRAAALAA